MANTPKFCRNCGNKLVEGAKFCNKCGTEVLIPVEDIVDEELLKEIEKNLTSDPVIITDETKYEEPIQTNVPEIQYDPTILNHYEDEEDEEDEEEDDEETSVQKKIIIGLCIAIFAILVTIGALFATGTIGFNSADKDDNAIVDESDNILSDKKDDSDSDKKKSKKDSKKDVKDDSKESDKKDDANGSVTSDLSFILPNSNVTELTDEEIAKLSNDDLRLAINEMYARHGYKFKGEDLQKYFDAKSWYKNEGKNEDTVKAEFSEIEMKNMIKLTKERSKRGN